MAIDFSTINPLGFGCMRFTGRETNEIDIANTSKMIDAYMKAGGNYFDTAWAYPNSETALRESLVKRYPREDYFLTTKCVTWTHCTCEEDLEKQLQESLENLGVEYVDLYLMHNLGGFRTASFEKYNCWEFVKSVKERGLAKHIGFSAHCTPDELRSFIEKYPEAEVIQLQANYLDWDSPAFQERECVEIAREAGYPVIAMEPVKGGLLADPSPAVKAILDEGLPNDSYATAALRFVASQDGIVCTLSGMNTVEQVEDNMKAFADFQPMTTEELAVVKHAQEVIAESGTIQCTGCDYCAKVCPVGVGISGSLTALNYYINFDDPAAAAYQLGFVVRFNGGKKMIDECIRCGACEEACPQNLPIMECFDRLEEEVIPHRKTVVLMKP